MRAEPYPLVQPKQRLRGVDIGLRSMNGLWFDLERGYGFYAYAGPTLMFKRWLEADMELGVGVQARFL